MVPEGWGLLREQVTGSVTQPEWPVAMMVSYSTGVETRASWYRVHVLNVPFARPADEVAIRAVVKAHRSSTYVSAARWRTAEAMPLYGGGARVAAALMLP